MKYIIALLCIFFVTSALPDGVYELKVDEEVDYSLLPDDDKMIGFLWKDFKIPSSEKVKKVKVYISTTKNFLGKWTGAFGSSTTVEPSYWTMTDDMNIAFTTKTGACTWDVDAADSKIIQMAYGGELKWGVWWIDCNDFTIDKIAVFTDKYDGGYEDEDSGKGKGKAEKVSDGVYKATIGDTYVYKELGTDKMLPINWSLFTIPKGETITKIEVEISTDAAKLGKWQGAFGSSTGIEPDYWIMTDDMEQALDGTKDTVVWEVSKDEAKAMQTQTDGQLKFGVWWIDCGTFTIETCTITTDAA
jgi:hypothetical protein